MVRKEREETRRFAPLLRRTLSGGDADLVKSRSTLRVGLLQKAQVYVYEQTEFDHTYARCTNNRQATSTTL